MSGRRIQNRLERQMAGIGPRRSSNHGPIEVHVKKPGGRFIVFLVGLILGGVLVYSADHPDVVRRVQEAFHDPNTVEPGSQEVADNAMKAIGNSTESATVFLGAVKIPFPIKPGDTIKIQAKHGYKYEVSVNGVNVGTIDRETLERVKAPTTAPTTQESKWIDEALATDKGRKALAETLLHATTAPVKR